LKIINILDEIEHAEIFVKDKGLVLIKNNIKKSLAEENVSEMDILNKEFDPYLAECIEVQPDNQDNIVKKIIKKGYYKDDKVLRVAKVKVSRKI